MMLRLKSYRQKLNHSDGHMLVLERPLMLQYHEPMTLVEWLSFSADHFLAAADLRAFESLRSTTNKVQNDTKRVLNNNDVSRSTQLLDIHGFWSPNQDYPTGFQYACKQVHCFWSNKQSVCD